MEPFSSAKVFFVLVFWFQFSSSSSSSSSSLSASSCHPLIKDSISKHWNHTAISDFRIVNRRILSACLNSNPNIQIIIDSNKKLSDDGFVKVRVSGIANPSENEWIALMSPSTRNDGFCPLKRLLYAQTGDLASLPLLCDYPVKAQWLKSDPDYLSCTNSGCNRYENGKCLEVTCNATLTFHVINFRTDISFVLLAGGFGATCTWARTDPLGFANPNKPLYGHLSSVDSTGTSMKLTWVSGDRNPQHVEYDNGKILISEVTTFSQKDMCASRLSYMTAIGNHERDYGSSGSYYGTPDSGGECGVPYETYFRMPIVEKDKPWYSIEQGHVHNYERTCAVYGGKCLDMPKKDENGIDVYDLSDYKAPPQVVIGMAGFTLDKRVLSECPFINPYLHVNVVSNSSSNSNKLSDDEFVQVTISGILLPSPKDWVAMISPSSSDVGYCPLKKAEYLQTGDLADLPLLCHYPVKAQYVKSDPDYLSCKKKECKKYDKIHGKCVVNTCNATLTFHVVNFRTDVSFVLFGGGFDTPCTLARSNPVGFANPNKPLYGHLSSTDSTGTLMRLTWVSGDSKTQQVQYGDGKTLSSQVSTFTPDDMCSSVLPSPAKDFGWHDPGFIHSAVMTGLKPSTNFTYRYGRDYVDSGTVYITPDSGGECGVPYETYFQMPSAEKDKPWYSIEQGGVHFTVISTEHDWTPNSEQYAWMKKDLGSVDRSRTPWLIFMGHRPMYSSSGLSVDTRFKSAVEPLLLQNKVDLVFVGHVHNYERTCSVYNSQCLAMPKKDENGVDTYDHSNYKAPVQAVIGMAGFSLDKFSDTTNSWSLVRISKFGYLRGHATKEELKFEFVNSDTREVEDSFRITK
ncbi:inactive purple acid phosphatase 27 [Tripterygium wilfordii]|uniref:Purple acid phosphatase n=1 Tax=Tripterygium wilfordii TaxID=458696 RepID=A0A7J7C5A1_TRIWF|nr:inactive purple acid phosphatase 27 [Tripterygium wilfordii]